MQKYIYVLIGLVLIGFLGWAAYTRTSQSKQAVSNGTLQVSASFYPLYFFASQIGGDNATVRNITPAGAEPHDFEPSARDIARIETGDMLVLNGGVESWGNKLKDSLRGSPVVVVTAADGLLSKASDPHVWLDPLLAKKEVVNITQGFVTKDPTNKAYYEKNEKILEAQLDQLDQEYKDGLVNCQSHDIITSHVAFAYLADRYGLHQVAIAGLSPDAEPSSKQLAAVSDFAKQHNTKYIFFESLVSPKLSQTIANEIGAKSLVLDPIEGLSDDDIAAGKDYFSVMQSNLANLQLALSCTPQHTTTP